MMNNTVRINISFIYIICYAQLCSILQTTCSGFLLISTKRHSIAIGTTTNSFPIKHVWSHNVDDDKVKYSSRQREDKWQRHAFSKSSSSSETSERGISQSRDPEYPYNFTGRLWFHPSLVKVPQDKQDDEDDEINKDTSSSSSSPGSNVKILSLFGYTLGGSVCLEYDTSPVGPYREYVTMSALVMKRGTVGQWGSRLYVSTSQAERVCRDIWGVPAELASIDFVDDGERLRVALPPNSCVDEEEDSGLPWIRVEGWKNTRIVADPPNVGDSNGRARWGNLPVYWTPTIKALWLPFIPFRKSGGDVGKNLSLHRLRLSASTIRLHWSGIERGQGANGEYSEKGMEEKSSLGIPLGLGLVVDNVLIEIGKRLEEDL
jgi:hypothetical protein